MTGVHALVPQTGHGDGRLRGSAPETHAASSAVADRALADQLEPGTLERFDHLDEGVDVAAHVVIADDAFVVMVGWQVMSLASCFLVAFEHEGVSA